MSNNNIINASKLNDNNFIAFHRNVINSASGITLKEMVAQVASYEIAVQKFVDYTRNVSEIMAKHDASVSGVERTVQFRGFRNYVKVLTVHPNETQRALGNEIWKLVKSFGYTAAVNRDAISSMVKKSLDHVKDVVAKEEYAAIYAGSELELWVNTLTEIQTNYSDLRNDCRVERANRVPLKNKDLREECMVQFYRTFHLAEYIATVKADVSCTGFVSYVSAAVNEIRYLYRGKTNAQKGEQNANQTTEQAAESTTEVVSDVMTEVA